MNKIRFGHLSLLRNFYQNNNFKKNAFYNLQIVKSIDYGEKDLVFSRFLHYKTPVNRPKAFRPSTLPVTNANKHLIINLIDEKDIDLGEIRLDKAKDIADSKELKLVIIDEVSSPPKFKLMNGNDLYQLQIKYRDDYKENVKEPKTKEIEVNLGIDDHDLDIKLKMLKNFFEKGYSIKFKVTSRIINKKVCSIIYA
jgi:translation initiation factor IF-3